VEVSWRGTWGESRREDVGVRMKRCGIGNGRTFDHASSLTENQGPAYITAQKTIVTRNGYVIIVV